MAGKNTITRRISLEGAEEIKESLKKLGEAGENAFHNMQKAADGVKGPGSGFTNSLQNMQKTMVSLGKATFQAGAQIRQFGQSISLIGGAVGAAVVGLGLLVKSATETADEFGKAAQKAGVTVEVYSKLQFAAEQAHVSNDQLQVGIQQLSKHLVEAKKGGNEMAAAFSQLGVKVTDASGKIRPMDEIFVDLVAGFTKMKDGAEKTALAMLIFGKSGAQLAPLLNQGRAGINALFDDVEKLGLGFTEQQVKISETFNDTLNLMFRALKGLKDQIAILFAPALTAAAQAVTDFLARNKDAIIGFVQGIIDAFNSLPAGVQETIGAIAAVLGTILFVFGPILIAVGLFVQVIGLAFAGIGTLIGAFTGLAGVGAFLATVIGGIVAFFGSWLFAIIALIVGITALVVVIVQHWPQIKAVILKTIADIIQAIATWVGNMSRAAEEIVASFRDMARNVALGLAEVIKDATTAADAITRPFVDAWNAVADVIQSIVDKMFGWLNDLIKKVEDAQAAISGFSKTAGAGGGGANKGGGGFAEGGSVNGPGTPTSDSIWARLSDGEFVMKARAVQKYGVGFMSRVNAMRAPRFAMGGLAIAAPGIGFAGGGTEAASAFSAPRNEVNLHIGGQTFRMMADDEVAHSLQSFSAGQRTTSISKRRRG